MVQNQPVRRRFWCHEFLPARHDSQRNWTDFLSVDEKPRLSIQHLQEWGIRGLSHFAWLCAGEIFLLETNFTQVNIGQQVHIHFWLAYTLCHPWLDGFVFSTFWLGVHRLPAPNIANELRRLQVLPSSLRWSTLSPGAHRWPRKATNLAITRWPIWISWNFYDHRLAPDFWENTSRDATTNFQNLK